jgi:mannitol-1-phosphate/altronate dehydrogenase
VVGNRLSVARLTTRLPYDRAAVTPGIVHLGIGAFRRADVAAYLDDVLIAAMTDPSIRIVSLTVTAKGYCHDPATGALDPSHPDILKDLARPETPVSAPGLIVRALALRRAAGVAPLLRASGTPGRS